MPPARREAAESVPEALDAQTIALRVIAFVLVAAASSLLASVLVPFVVALVLAVALSPLADWGERRLGLGRSLSSLAVLLLVVAVILATGALLVYQAGSILANTDRYLDQLGKSVAGLSRTTGGDRLLEAVGALESGSGGRSPGGEGEGGDAGGGGAGSREYWDQAIARNARAVGAWVVSGIGGVLGALGGLVLCLAFLFYMLLARSDWMERLQRAGRSLGFATRDAVFERVRSQIATYIGRVGMVSAAYVVVITLALWAIGVPQPLLWGVLTGVLEVIPYFGPILAGALPTLVSLGTGGASWQPLAVVGVFVALQTVEGYVIAPLLYGQSVDIDPVTVLLGVLVFGFLWGPVGLALAMPMMILLRGLLVMAPDTPALDALADADQEAEAVGGRA
jgi:predicted PurR-regulated permease PerM